MHQLNPLTPYPIKVQSNINHLYTRYICSSFLLSLVFFEPGDLQEQIQLFSVQIQTSPVKLWAVKWAVQYGEIGRWSLVQAKVCYNRNSTSFTHFLYDKLGELRKNVLSCLKVETFGLKKEYKRGNIRLLEGWGWGWGWGVRFCKLISYRPTEFVQGQRLNNSHRQ